MSDSLACVMRAGALRQALVEIDASSLAGRGVDLEVIHEAARADQAEPHAALRAVLAVENALQIGDAGTLVADADAQQLRRLGLLDHEFGAAAAGIAEGVARNFGNGGGDPGLVLPLEAEQFGDAARALTHRDDVALGVDRQASRWTKSC